MGPYDLDPTKLLNWVRGTHTRLTTWEFQYLLILSNVYMSGLQEFKAKNCLPPFVCAENEDAHRKRSIDYTMQALGLRK